MSSGIQRAVLRASDPVSLRPVVIAVEWRREILTGVDEARDNVGSTQWAWDDVPPVKLHRRDGETWLTLEALPVLASGTHQMVFEASQVRLRSDLRMGTYWVDPEYRDGADFQPAPLSEDRRAGS